MTDRYKPSTAPGRAGVAAALAAALVVGAPLVQKWEGLRLNPYRDIVNVPTVCYGETQVQMRRYTRAECDAMLRERFRRDYMLPALACAPALAERPLVWAASGSLAYNIGVKAFCRSSAADAFRARQWVAGCHALMRWNRAGGRVVPGLTNRRIDERALCLRGAG